MPLHMSAEATCDHCHTTAPCRLDLRLLSGHQIGKREHWALGAAVRGIPTWFWKFEGLACSEACRDVLAKEPRFADYGGRWQPCT